MAKIIRLYRLESIFGRGLYQSDERLGQKVEPEIVMDTDRWFCGARREVEFTTRGGRTKVKRNDCGPEYYASWYRALSNEVPEQLQFDLETVDWGTNVLLAMPCFGMDLDGDTPRGMGTMGYFMPENGGRNERSMTAAYANMRYCIGSAVLAEERRVEQLKLEVTREPVAVRHKIHKGNPMTLINVLEKNLWDHSQDSMAYSTVERPMPSEDGLKMTWEDIANKYQFAFRSIEQLSNWMDGMPPEKCLDGGAVIKVLDVKAAKHGGRQSVYRPRDVVKEFTVVRKDLYDLAKSVR